MEHLSKVRDRCRAIAHRYRYDEILFDRIPTFYFNYFRATDPLAVVHLVAVFMLINDISANLMMAFYSAGGHDPDMLDRLHQIFIRQWAAYRQRRGTPELFERFGHYYAYHMETKTLRYIDMSPRPYSGPRQRHRDRFVPDEHNWMQYREVRERLRAGNFVAQDDRDLDIIAAAERNGMYARGPR